MELDRTQRPGTGSPSLRKREVFVRLVGGMCIVFCKGADSALEHVEPVMALGLEGTSNVTSLVNRALRVLKAGQEISKEFPKKLQRQLSL
jgi:hypothetical protein